jgi:hypothetical protein
LIDQNVEGKLPTAPRFSSVPAVATSGEAGDNADDERFDEPFSNVCESLLGPTAKEGGAEVVPLGTRSSISTAERIKTVLLRTMCSS